MLSKKLFLIIFISAISFLQCNNSSRGDEPSTRESSIDNIKLPPGFSINVFTDKVPGARSMTQGSKGALFVGTREKGVVYAVVDTNNDHKADKVYVIAENLNSPNGVAFKNGSLYVAEINRVIRFDSIENNLSHPPKYKVVNDNFPDKSDHGWKFIRFGPDGKLYVPVGAPCNVCLSDDPRFASIMRMNADGSQLEVFASGIRNTVGFDWNPSTKELWFTDNGRDMLGDDLPPDELNRAYRKGLHFGFPFFHGNGLKDPEYGSGKDSHNYVSPEQLLGPHVAALGMRFYEGQMFPKEYKGNIFIAEHGSWNRSKKIGYRITMVKMQNNKSLSYQTFAEGWLQGNKVSGRPVDVEVLSDGSMLVSDDYAGVIYRITYKK